MVTQNKPLVNGGNPEKSELLNGLSAEEQVLALQSLRRGTLAVLQIAMKYVREYSQLVEEDLRDRPDLATYLQNSTAVLNRCVEWMADLEKGSVIGPEFEELDLEVLLSGVVNRCRSLVDSEEQLQYLPSESGPLPVRGALFLLQDLFLRLLSMRLSAGGALSVSTWQQQLDAAFLRSVRSSCSPGPYIIVSLSAAEPFNSSAAEPFPDAFLRGRFSALLRNSKEGEIALLPLYGVVRLHGGDVFINRCGEQPSAAGVALPAVPEREDMQAPRNHSSAPEGSETILLVDDEDMIWDVILDMLQGLGYSVILAANGREAIEVYAANSEHIDLVLLDMVMPEMTGSEAFYRLRELDPKVKVLLSSGYVGESETQSLLRDGAQGFLEKPYSVEQLARRMRDILDAAPASQG